MILAAINNRVGTWIPPYPTSSSSGNSSTAGYLDMNPTTMPSTDPYTSVGFASTVSSIETTTKNNRYLSEDPDQARIIVGTALALVSGLVHVAMAILHFGYVTVYLSDSIVQGFTTGCAIHIIASQLPPLLGIKIKTVSGQSKVIKVNH